MLIEKIQVLASEPVSVSEAKLHLRVEGETEDDYIASLIKVAREFCEDYTRSSIVLQELKVLYDRVAGVVYLPRPPVAEVLSVTVDGEEVAKDQYELLSKRAVVFYSTLEGSRPFGVSISYKAGYEAVPAQLKQAILMLVGHLYEARQGEPGEAKYRAQVSSDLIPPTVSAVLDCFKVKLL